MAVLLNCNILNKINLRPLWLILLLFPMQVASQKKITGTVTDSESNKPIMYATIYVNGTTIGTITNPAGEFSLDNVVPPCEIVISHVSYTAQIIVLKQHADTVFHIRLKPGDVELGVVDVKDKNLREENLTHFKSRFLGTDYWGKNAFIENDSVLVFHREKVLNNNEIVLESEVIALDSNSVLLTVNTKGPLLVNLPLLGYKLHVNLIHYKELQTGNDDKYRFHTLGYFYFQSENESSKRKTNRYRKKQLEAWYNSDRHFCHSLFHDRLKENGFLLLQISNPEEGKIEFNKFELDNYMVRENNEIKIIGLKNKILYIQYIEYFKKPVDLIKRDKGQGPHSPNMISSKIYFLKDTCTIRADGSRPDNSIMFGPAIGNKRVGAMLPYDFQPGNEN